MRKKILSAIMALVMVLTLLPVTALANGGDGTPAAIGAEMNSLSSGAYILNDNITLTEPSLTVEKGAVVSIDLNGHTLQWSGKLDGQNRASVIINYGELTITDSSPKKEGKISLTYDGVQDNTRLYGINNKGSITLSGGTVEVKSTAVQDCVVYVRGVYMSADGASILVDGGRVVAEKAGAGGNTYGIYMSEVESDDPFDPDTESVYGGVITIAQGGVSASGKGNTYGVCANGLGGRVAVSGGLVRAVSTNESLGTAMGLCHTKGPERSVVVSVSGGEIAAVSNKQTAIGISIDQTSEDTATAITGGKITAETEPSGLFSSAAALSSDMKLENGTTVTGGSFSSTPKACVPEGRYKITEENGLFTVTEYPVAVGDTYYDSLEAAVQRAESGSTINVLKDIALTSTISAKKVFTFEGVTQSDGSKPVISCETGIFSQSGTAVYTLKNLELQATRNGQWYIYHSAGIMTIENCDFTMADSVTNTGNVVMGEGAGDTKSLIFKNNTVTANSRAALVGVGNGSVITGNTIDLISEKHDNTTSRTSMISLTAAGGENAQGVTITGNTFKNANRGIAVDNSSLDASKITIEDNTFDQVRFAFELSPAKNKEVELSFLYHF